VRQRLPDRLSRLGITVLERGWLSSNNVLVIGESGDATLVDSGYSIHAEQTVDLVEAVLQGRPLSRLVNTHLHSDHCGGNAALHAKWGSEISVPSTIFDAAASWDEGVLLFRATDQRCDQFPVHHALSHGSEVKLGDACWEAHSAPGHDPDAVMLFQPDERVLISGDALWQQRIAVIFPELIGKTGFDRALDAVDSIERMAPALVIPGHGKPFRDVAGAIAQSRERLRAFAKAPDKHARYAVRALTMFHMLEHRRKSRQDLLQWIKATPLLASIEHVQDHKWVEKLVDGLVESQALRRTGDVLSIAAPEKDKGPDS
jgi:glyoxylase-like metal-dependent hydrolase (beta-lactamase superfamily II)